MLTQFKKERRILTSYLGFPGGSVVKNLPANAAEARDTGSIPGLGRSPGGGNGNPLQYSCLENSMDTGAWWAAVHGVTKSWTELSTNICMYACTYFNQYYTDLKEPQSPLVPTKHNFWELGNDSEAGTAGLLQETTWAC